MIRNLKKTILLMTCSAGLLAAACAPTLAVRGNMLEDYQLAEVKPGTSTRSDVLRSLGSPTTQSTFDSNIWYYIGQETQKSGILDPKVIKERIVQVTFTSEGIVQEARDIDRAHMDIPYTRDKTPTHGNDASALQEFFGNLGKFNPKGAEGKTKGAN
jgi:outer membrane protein assembly factor BamE (lipoprotein component of BamABCDE complex)